jgi:hypothetical protein
LNHPKNHPPKKENASPRIMAATVESPVPRAWRKPPIEGRSKGTSTMKPWSFPEFPEIFDLRTEEMREMSNEKFGHVSYKFDFQWCNRCLK